MKTIIAYTGLITAIAGLAGVLAQTIRHMDKIDKRLTARKCVSQPFQNSSEYQDIRAELKTLQDNKMLLALHMPRIREKGIITWYGSADNDGLLGAMTANGEILNDTDNTCASRTLAFNTIVWIFSISTNRSSWCRITDRGSWMANIIENGKPKQVLKMSENDPGTWIGILDVNKKTGSDLQILERGSAEVIVFY